MRGPTAGCCGWASGLVLVVGCATSHAVTAPAERALLGLEQSGSASWYGLTHQGRQTASGEIYDMRQLTAAHRTFPFGTRVLITNLDNGRTVEVRINDRGPFVDGRVIDVSRAAAERLGGLGRGLMRVRIRVVGLPPVSEIAPSR